MYHKKTQRKNSGKGAKLSSLVAKRELESPRQISRQEAEKKEPVKGVQAPSIETYNAFEAFFSRLPPSSYVHYTKDILCEGPLAEVQSVTERAIYPLENIPTGDALFLTFIRQEMYGTYNFNTGFPPDLRFVNLPKDWGTMTKFPIGFNILANNVSLFDATYRGDNAQTIPPTVGGLASGMNINKDNVLDFGLLRTVLCIPENTALEIEYKTFYFDDYGTPAQLPNTGPPNYYLGMGNVAEYTKIHLKGYKMPMKALKEMQSKYSF